MSRTALVTGFEPFGGHSLNPSGLLATALDGTTAGDVEIVGRALPVQLAGLGERIESLLDQVRPSAVIALGLYPGEATIRIERFGVNLADFTIADNAGVRLEDTAIDAGGATALAATLPLSAIVQVILAAGIPALLSTSAGTYLCNAVLYTLLQALARRGMTVPCGFIHLPYMPEQVAEMMARARAGELALPHGTSLASMDLATMERAIRLAITVTVTWR
jgi:pyroglutamyl-peptidase